jgi:trk system potassium uptake protein TrkH
VVSIVTTTGYATADYEQWPAMSQLILLLCMFLGASAGSTGGGMKCLRIMLCFKFCYQGIVFPDASPCGPACQNRRQTGARRRHAQRLGFLALYMGLFGILSSVMLAGLGSISPPPSALSRPPSATSAPVSAWSGRWKILPPFPFPGKWLLIWCMLLGRLEIYTVIILFVPEFWRR